MLKEVNLIYRIVGPSVEKGIDVYDLAPALLAIADLLNKTNKKVYPNGREIGVNIKPFEKGSFILDIAVFAKDNLQQIIDYANTDSLLQIKQVLEWLGIIGGTGAGLIKLMQFLSNSPQKNVWTLS